LTRSCISRLSFCRFGQEVQSLLDEELDAAVREVIFSAAAAAQVEGFQVQACLP